MQTILITTNLTLLLACFTYASWSDYRSREVSNKIWILLAPPTFTITFTKFLFYEPSQLVSYALCCSLTAIFVTVLFYTGGFGGADAKALMCLALALPFYPKNILTPLSNEISPISQVFFPLTVFSNSVLLVIIPVLSIITRNLYWRWKTGRRLFEGNQANESLGRKALVLMTGYKIPIARLKEKWHIYPLEDVEENTSKSSQRKLVILPKDKSRNAIIERLDREIQSGTIKDEVWASPGLPMLVLITIGLVIALFFGDIIWTLVGLLFR